MNDVRQDSTVTSRPPLPRVALIALVILVVVAILGVVLARSRSASAPAPALGTPGVTRAMPPVRNPVTPTKKVESELTFLPGKPQIPQPAVEQLIKFSDTVRGATGKVRIAAQVEEGPEVQRTESLARIRLTILQHALQANGIKGERVSAELTKQHAGTLQPGDLDRITLSLLP